MSLYTSHLAVLEKQKKENDDKLANIQGTIDQFKSIINIYEEELIILEKQKSGILIILNFCFAELETTDPTKKSDHYFSIKTIPDNKKIMSVLNKHYELVQNTITDLKTQREKAKQDKKAILVFIKSDCRLMVSLKELIKDN